MGKLDCFKAKALLPPLEFELSFEEGFDGALLCKQRRAINRAINCTGPE
jgi:hypothetical protein